MILYSFAAYLEYRWKARGRHGTHSPFVYDLIEHVLLDKGVINRTYIVEYPSLALRYENLISRIAANYNYREIVYLPRENEGEANGHADMLLLSETQPLQWVHLLDKYFSRLNSNSAVVVAGIHNAPEHTKHWRKLCADPKVRMSIDLYGIGLLFFREEFRQPQHFILKY